MFVKINFDKRCCICHWKVLFTKIWVKRNICFFLNITLAARNILLTKTLEAKVSDFGNQKKKIS